MNNSSLDIEVPNPGSQIPDNFSGLWDFMQLFNENETSQLSQQSLIFESGEEYLLITLYILILLLGLIFNAAIIWVIVGKIF